MFEGSLVDGAAFTALYTYDTSLGQRGDMVNSQVGDVLSGSAEDPLARGIPVTGSLVIGSVTRAVSSDPSYPNIRDNASVFVQPNFSPGSPTDFNWAGYSVAAEACSATFQQSFGEQLAFQINALLGTLPTNLETSYSLDINPDVYLTGGYPTLFGTWYQGTFDRDTNTGSSSFAQLLGHRITVTVRDDNPAPVPLPAGLPLLALAFGSFALLRRFSV